MPNKVATLLGMHLSRSQNRPLISLFFVQWIVCRLLPLRAKVLPTLYHTTVCDHVVRDGSIISGCELLLTDEYERNRLVNNILIGLE